MNSVPSSGVWPPHQSGLRSNVAPVCEVVVDELPRPGPCRSSVEVGAGDVVLRRDDRLRVVDRNQVREVPVRRFERHGDCVGVGRDRSTGRQDALETGVAGRHEALHRRDDVIGGQRRAVVLPLGFGPELERPDRAIVVWYWRLGGKCRRQAARIVGIHALAHQEFERLGDDAVTAEILHRDRVDRDGALDRAPDRTAGDGTSGRARTRAGAGAGRGRRRRAWRARTARSDDRCDG